MLSITIRIRMERGTLQLQQHNSSSLRIDFNVVPTNRERESVVLDVTVKSLPLRNRSWLPED